MSDAGGAGDPTETVEMDWSHSPQVSRQLFMTNPNLDSAAEKEKRTTEKQLAPRSHLEADVNETSWLHLETVGEIGSGSECLEESCWRPRPRRGDEGFD